MKTRYLSFITIIFSAIMILAASSCQTMNRVFGSPEVSLKGISIKSIDFEGITFNADYEITNPYPLGCSVKGLDADVIYETKKLTSLSADKGLKIAARGKAANSLSFKIPYDTVISFANGSSSTKNKKALPFTIDGNVTLDLSAITFLDDQSISIPFKKDFEVPVFKPSLSVSNPQLKMPSLTELKDSFVKGGMGLTKAVSVANAIISGGSVSDAVFDGVNLNFDFSFNLDVKNEGSAPWKYKIENCALKTQGGPLANLSVNTNSAITSNCSVPVKATLNTVQTGKFIVQLLNKKGSNPMFELSSGLTFTELPSYAQNIPLSYQKEIPLSNVKNAK